MGINKAAMRNGPQLTVRDVQAFTQKILDWEIKDTLLGINDNKALGIDGFNAYFFKRT